MSTKLAFYEKDEALVVRLAQIAVNDESAFVRSYTLYTLNSIKAGFIDVIYKHKSDTGENLLIKTAEYLVTMDKNWVVRLTAVRCLDRESQQALLIKIADNKKEHTEVRSEAALYLADLCDNLRDWDEYYANAENSATIELRAKMTAIAINQEEDEEIRCNAIRGLIDEKLLMEFAENDYSENLRENAEDRLRAIEVDKNYYLETKSRIEKNKREEASIRSKWDIETSANTLELLAKRGNLCTLCGTHIENTKSMWTAYKTPRTQGGSTDDSNVLFLCYECALGEG
jgi:hypothetical protein